MFLETSNGTGPEGEESGCALLWNPQRQEQEQEQKSSSLSHQGSEDEKI